ncbi:hypothetical protein M0R45_013288 [Rubus argutus]|uniref:Uncharacterized protein n=1 Tax=Rubus argutus TaxID=59490 RepID=A0AAW1XJ94_RUBAR
MSFATSVEDAKARAANALEVFAQQIRSLLPPGMSYWRQRTRRRRIRNREFEHVKQMVSEYKEQLSKLEVANYSLAMHLKQAQQCNNSIPLSFYPHDFDVD